MDTFTRAERSRIMAAVKGKDTKPELIVRRLVHALGFRYRLHVRTLPGIPDLAFPRFQKIIFVHGCFWHRCRCVKGRSMPASRREYWEKKFEANVQRDKIARKRLRALGWKVLIVWECQTTAGKREKLRKKIANFLAT